MSDGKRMYEYFKKTNPRGFGWLIGSFEQIASIDGGEPVEPQQASVEKLEGDALLGYLESFVRHSPES